MIIQMPSLIEQSFISTKVKIKDKTYDFVFRWNSFIRCCILVIKLDGEIILDETALVNYRLIDIDHRLLPTLIFYHQDQLTFEPTKETFNQYVIEYAE